MHEKITHVKLIKYIMYCKQATSARQNERQSDRERVREQDRARQKVGEKSFISSRTLKITIVFSFGKYP